LAWGKGPSVGRSLAQGDRLVDRPRNVNAKSGVVPVDL
jgi:hypothetical protein